MITMSNNQEKQAGVVSIFTVLFFMIFVSIVTVGFVKIIGDEQRQALNNDLSASALAAAQSGVEEGKRVLLYCKTRPNPSAEKAACDSALGSTACNSISSNATITGALDIDSDADGSGIVSGNSSYQQRWTCLTIDPTTDNVDDVLVGNGDSEIIPLTGVGGFNAIQLSWHATASDKEGIPAAYPAGTNRISQPEWTNLGYPAAVRIEIISHPAGSVNLSTIDANTRTLVLFPSSLAAAPTSYDIAAADPRAADPNLRTSPSSPLPVRCSTAPYPAYACSISLTVPASLPSTAPGSNSYYARISAVYAKTHINLVLKNGASTVDFNNVQPIVDVTGRTNDVFRRVKARVMFDSAFYIPNYAIESGQTICKDMLVTDRGGAGGTSTDSCNP